MLDGLKPYDIYFVQKASPSSGDAFDFSYIYKFWTERTNTHQSLKYIIRVEAVGDVLAIQGRRIKKLFLVKVLTNTFHPILLLAFSNSYFP